MNIRMHDVWQGCACRHAWLWLFMLLIGAMMLPPSVQASDDGVTDYMDIKAGAYVIDMGQPTQTFGNGLKPYGLIFDLVINHQIPVLWVIQPGKARDGVDFSVDGRDFRSGPFVIEAAYAQAAQAVLANWQAKGVVVYGPTLNARSGVPVYDTIRSFPRAVLDDQNGKIAQEYLINAEISSAFYRFKSTGALNACDDVYVMPHADPAWETHRNLIDFNRDGGSIWAACHAVSVLENVDDPEDIDSAPDMNFLSNSGLVDYGDHDDGTPPFSYGDADHPIMQFLGTIDAGMQSGSEQIYLPAAGGWRASTRIAAWDPDHPELGSASPGEAAVIAFGRAFGNNGYGYVMYEGGHSHNKGEDAEYVGAQRAFFNFLLLAGIDRRIDVATELPDADPGLDGLQFMAGEPVTLRAAVSGASGLVSYTWSSSCGGSFDNPYAGTTVFTPPAGGEQIDCIVRVTVQDACSRRVFESSHALILGKPDLAVSLSVAQDPVVSGADFEYELAVSNDGGPATGVSVDWVLPDEVRFVAADNACTHSGTPTGGVLKCALGNLSSAASRTLRATVSAPQEATTLVSSATVSSPDGDLNPQDNDAQAQTQVRPATDLELLEYTPSASLIGVGEAFNYQLRVRNNGPLAAGNILVSKVLPAAIDYLGAGGDGWTCSYQAQTRQVGCVQAALAVGAVSSLLEVEVRAAAAGEHSGTAEVGSPDFADSVPQNNMQSLAVQVRAAADLSVIKTTDKLDAGDGSSLVFYLEVSNKGTDTAQDVRVVDRLAYSSDKDLAAGFYAFCQGDKYFFTGPQGTRLQGNKDDAGRRYQVDGLDIQVTFSGIDCADPNSADPLPEPAYGSEVEIIWTISPGLGASERVVLEFEAKKEADVKSDNRALVSSATDDPVAANNQDVIRVGKTDTAGASARYADLEIHAVAVEGAPDATGLVALGAIGQGAEFAYVVTVFNHGPENIEDGDASNGFASIAFRNVLPAGLEYLGFESLDAGVAYTPADGAPVDSGDVNNGSWGCVLTAASATLDCTFVLDQGDRLEAGRYAQGLLLRVRAPATGTLIENTVDELGFTVPPAVSSDAWFDPYDHNDAFTSRVDLVPAPLDLIVTQEASAVPADVGGELDYRVRVRNDATYARTATSVAVEYAVPAGLVMLETDVSQGLLDGSSWAVGDLAPGAEATLTLRARLDTLDAVITTAQLSNLDQADANPDNNSASVTRDIVNADLSLTKSVDQTAPAPGDTIVFTLRVNNQGPNAAEGARIAQVLDHLNPAFTIVDPANDISVSNGSYKLDEESRALSWDIGTLAAGADAELNLRVRVDGEGDIANTAIILDAGQPDGNSANDKGEVTVAVQSADLSLAMTQTPERSAQVPFEPVRYVLRVHNPGPRAAAAVEVTNELPDGLSLLSANPGQGSYDSAAGVWQLGTLAVGATAELTLDARAQVAGSLTHSATISASSVADTNPNNDRVSLVFLSGGEADIYMTASASTSGVSIGDTFDFIVEAVNYGPDAATSLRIEDVLPAGTVLLEAISSVDGVAAGSYATDSGVWQLDSLAVNSIATLRLRVRAEQSGSLTNSARVLGMDQADPDSYGNQASRTVVVAPGIVVSGSVWADANHDGVRDSTEAGIPGVTLVLYEVAGDRCRGVQTGADGAYYFTGVTDGGYRLIQSGADTAATVPVCAPPATAPVGHVATTSGVRLLNVSGRDLPAQDFGNFRGAKLGGRVFADDGSGGSAHDGIAHAAEAGLAGVRVVARNDGGELDQTVSAADGAFTLWLVHDAGAVDIVADTPQGYWSVSESAGDTGAAIGDALDDRLRFTPIAGTIYSGLAFGDVAQASFEPDNTATVLPGNVVFHAHRFTAHSAGDVSFRIAEVQASPSLSGWSAVLLNDMDCDGEAQGEHTAPLTVSAQEGVVCVLVKVLAPADLPAAAQYRVEVEAAFRLQGVDVTHTLDRFNVTTSAVQGEAGLELGKEVDKAAAAPGDTLTYTLNFRNASTVSITDVSLHDAVPPFTQLAEPVRCPDTLPPGLAACVVVAPVAQDNVSGYTGAVEWRFTGAMAAGAEGQVQYRVQVEP